MEDCFVRTMLDHRRYNNNNKSKSPTHQLLPLDRFGAAVHSDPNTATSAREEEEQMTCLSLRPYDSSSLSNDQVYKPQRKGTS